MTADSREHSSTFAGPWVKICGVSDSRQAAVAVDAGADAVGLNFVPGSKRQVSVDAACEIVRTLGRSVQWVGVFANQPVAEVLETARRVGLDRVQLHGDEPPEALAQLGNFAYKALRVASADDLAGADDYGGDRLLLDAKVGTALGGTGHTFDWSLAVELARLRPLVVAGGLTELNVVEAIRALRPAGVDTASGVESSPGIKDPRRTALFIERARAAWAEVSDSSGRAGAAPRRC